MDELSVAPEHPFADRDEEGRVVPGHNPGGQVKVTSPVDAGALYQELAAMVPGVTLHLVVHHPADPQRPLSPDNAGWLSWAPADLTLAMVAQVLEAHDPAASDGHTTKGRGEVAQKLADLRERLRAGEALDNSELTEALALLLG